MITVNIVGPVDHEKWYRIWKQAAVLLKVCVSDRGKGGAVYGLGEKHILIQNLGEAVVDVRLTKCFRARE